MSLKESIVTRGHGNGRAMTEDDFLTEEECIILEKFRAEVYAGATPEQLGEMNADPAIAILQTAPMFENLKYSFISDSLKKAKQSKECGNFEPKGSNSEHACLALYAGQLQDSLRIKGLTDTLCSLIGEKGRTTDLKDINQYYTEYCISERDQKNLAHSQLLQKNTEEPKVKTPQTEENGEALSIIDQANQKLGQQSAVPSPTPANAKDIHIEDERGILSKIVHKVTDTIKSPFTDDKDEEGESVNLEGLKDIARRAMPNAKLLLVVAKDTSNKNAKSAREAIQGFIDFVKNVKTLVPNAATVEIPTVDQILALDINEMEAQINQILASV